MDNKIMCEVCGQKKDRGEEMFPVQLIIPVYDKRGNKSIEFKRICNNCFCKIADALQDII